MKLASPRKHRRPSLTPMIDVVFLLLVFFMLASRFSMDMAINLPQAGPSTQTYQGPPRLVDVSPDSLFLNGVELPIEALVSGLHDLMEAAQDTVVLRARDDADLQRIVTTMETLDRHGFETLVLVE